jgi:hypothetical protein
VLYPRRLEFLSTLLWEPDLSYCVW